MIRAAAVEQPTASVHAQPLALKQRAYTELKRRILCGELAAGTVQSVRQLAARLDMSKTPVHAAIERLEAEGLVTLAPQQGVVVREMSLQDIVNHFEIRQAIEPFVMRRLAGRLTPRQLQLLRENQAQHRHLAVLGHAAQLIEVDAQFHQLLCGFLGNEEITRVMQQLRDKVQRVVYRIAQKFPDRIIESCDEHEAILEALASGDGERAAVLVNQHLEKGLRRFWSNHE